MDAVKVPDCFTLFVIVCVVVLFFGVITTGGFRWLNPFESEWGERFSNGLSSCWDHLTGDFDRLAAFVAENTVWVFATVTGGCGLLLSAGLLFTALPERAQAESDTEALSGVESELDASLPIPIPEDEGLDDVSIPVEVSENQSRLNSRPPFPDRSRESLADGGGFSRLDDLDQAILGNPSANPPPRRTQPDPTFNLSEPAVRPAYRFDTPPVLSLQMERLAISDGHVVEPQLTEWDFNALRDDEWLRRGLLSDFAAQPVSFERTIRGADQEQIPANPESTIQVVPGAGVSEQDLMVRKQFPSDVINGAFRYQISVTNQSLNVIDGVVIRESVPMDWIVRNLEPLGRLEESIATWVLYELQPRESRILELDVFPTREGRATTLTEVSAIAAVSRSIRVGTGDFRGVRPRQPQPDPQGTDDGEPLLPGVELPSFESDQRDERRPFPGRETAPSRGGDEAFGNQGTDGAPALEIRVQQPDIKPIVGSQFEVRFVISNIGTGTLEPTVLRVMLDSGLDHPRLSRDDYLPQDRWVQQPVNAIEPGESVQLPLRITANREGQHFCTVEIRREREQIELTSFVVESRVDSGATRSPTFQP